VGGGGRASMYSRRVFKVGVVFIFFSAIFLCILGFNNACDINVVILIALKRAIYYVFLFFLN